MSMSRSVVISTDARSSPHLVNVTVVADSPRHGARITIAGQIHCASDHALPLPCTTPCTGHRVAASLGIARRSAQTIARVLVERVRDHRDSPVLVSTYLDTEGTVQFEGAAAWINPKLLVEKRDGDRLQVSVILENDGTESSCEDLRVAFDLPQEASADLQGVLANSMLP